MKYNCKQTKTENSGDQTVPSCINKLLILSERNRETERKMYHQCGRLLLLLSVLLSPCCCSDEEKDEFRPATIGESVTLDCSGEAESWTFANKNGSTEVIEEGRLKRSDELMRFHVSSRK